jgi:hypothetical protein
MPSAKPRAETRVPHDRRPAIQGIREKIKKANEIMQRYRNMVRELAK